MTGKGAESGLDLAVQSMPAKKPVVLSLFD